MHFSALQTGICRRKYIVRVGSVRRQYGRQLPLQHTGKGVSAVRRKSKEHMLAWRPYMYYSHMFGPKQFLLTWGMS
jgi:hypothetical protein